MKKRVIFLSLLLTLAIAVNSVVPVLSQTIREAFPFQPQVGSVIQSAKDYSADDTEDTAEAAQSDKETAFADGKILIYSYAQLSAIGSGKSMTYGDGSTAEYAADAEYKIVRDIPLPRGAVWQLPSGFKGKITGDRQAFAPLYDSETDTLSLYNPYQLATMVMDNADTQPVLSGDADAKSFGMGQPLTTGDGSILTYGSGHNYIVSSQFCSEVPEKPVSVSTSKKQTEAAGAQADGSAGTAAYDGRDFDGQVLKEINGTTYILIGNDAQLRAIGTNTEVYTRVYRVVHINDHYVVDKDSHNNDIILYGGDADLDHTQNGYADFDFHNIHDAERHYYSGVDQQTGYAYTDLSHITHEKYLSTNATGGKWHTGVTYSSNANYIVFRDIDLGGSSDPWTPLMFSGNMYGIKSVGSEKLWNGDAIDNATAMNDRTTQNRPVISNVYVNNTQPIEVNKFIGIGFFATITNEINTADIGISAGTVHVENLELSGVEVHNTATTAEQATTLVSAITSTTGWLVGGIVDILLAALSFGEVDLSLHDTLSALLNARTKDPTIFATGGFAGRVVGDVDIFNCAVTDSVSVENVKNYTGGFIGYSEGVTQYSGLSQALNIATGALASLLNVVPGLGLGDLVTILLNNALPLGKLIPTGYYEPRVRSCTVDSLGGQLGHFNGTPQNPDVDYVGGFIGCQIGTVITGSEVINSTYTVIANEYGGGFAGVAHDGEIKGTLNDLGLDIIDETSIKERINQNLDLIGSGSFQSQSLLQNCRIFDSNVTVNGGSNLGGFAGALCASYAIDCDIKQTAFMSRQTRFDQAMKTRAAQAASAAI